MRLLNVISGCTLGRDGLHGIVDDIRGLSTDPNMQDKPHAKVTALKAAMRVIAKVHFA